MKKELLLFLLTLVAMESNAIGAESYNTLVDGVYYRFFDNEAWVASKGQGIHIDGDFYISAEYSGKVVIPSTVEYDGKTYMVTAINDEAFSGCSIDTLIVPMTVNKVGPVGGTVDHLFIDSWYWWSMLQDTKNDRKIDIYSSYLLPASLLCCAAHIHVGGQEYDTEHLVLPEGLTSIPDFAVMGSSRMKSITIPSTMTSIGKAFCHSCVSLTSAVIPDNITSLGGLAFSYCKSLEEVVLGDGIENIFDNSFYYCEKLKTITVGRRLKSISDGCFKNREEYVVSNIIIRDMATWCGLKGCRALTGHDVPYHLFDVNGNEILNVAVPSGVEAIEEYCFYKSSIQSLSLPASVKSIGDWAFYNCLSLQHIAIPSNSLLESIGVYAFHRCDLTSVTIPDLTKSIGQGAFRNCLNLSTVVLGRSVIDIGSGAFSIDSWEEGTPKPMTVMSRIEEPYAIPNDVFSEITYRDGTLYVPFGTKEIYSRFDGWRNFLNIQEQSEASDKCLLTIQDASGGKMKLEVKKGEQYAMQIELEKGWRLHSVTLNGEDMTSQLSDDLRFTTPVMVNDAVISIVYEQEANAISPLDADKSLRVNGVRGGVAVNGAAAGTPCQVYQLDGKLVCEQLLHVGSTMIPLPAGQVYVVRVGSKTIKVMVE